jgi:hypothetical protein
MASPARILVTVHGIRTFGQWQDRLRKLTLAANPDMLVENYGYGYFSVIAFVIPLFRWLAVRSFRNNLKALMRAHEGASFTFVAHSFGTHLVAHALRGMKPAERPDVELIILSGSVLRSAFDWASLMNPAPGMPGVRRVINDCGLNDSVLILSQAGVLFTGMAGRVGFYGFTGADLVNRFFPGGHSHYFMPPGDDPDAFMKRYWVPVLAAGEAASPGLEIPVAGTLKGIQYALYRIADPIKLALYGLLAFILINFAYLQPRAEARLEQARREYLAAAAQMTSDRTLPDTFSAISSMVQRGLLPSGSDRDNALMLGRFSLQRLVPAATAIDGIAEGSIFGWGDFSYLKADAPLRIPIENPIAAIRDEATRKLAVIDRNSSILFVDVESGRILQQGRADMEGDVISPVEFRRLRDAQGRYLVSFTTEVANDDENNKWIFDLDLARNTITPAGNDVTPTENCMDFADLPSIDREDEDELSQERRKELETEGIRRRQVIEKCLISVPPEQSAVSFLSFPRAIPEAKLWKSEKLATISEENSTSCSISNQLNFPSRRRTDGQRLDFSRLSRDGDDTNPEEIIGIFADTEQPIGRCFIDFEGAAGKHFILTLAYPGNWNVTWLICSLHSEFEVEKCLPFRQNGNSLSAFFLSPDKRFLAVPDRGLSNRPAWALIDLEAMNEHAPLSWPNYSTIAMTFTNDTLMTVFPARTALNGVELWAYEVGTPPRLRARRIFPAPEGLGLTDDQMRIAIDQTTLFESDGKIVLATPFQQLTAVAVQDVSAFPRWLRESWSWLTGKDTGESVIAPLWSVTETGLDPRGEVTMAASPERDILAMASGTSLRLFQTSDGRFLSNTVDLATLPDCAGPIESLTIAEDLSISARMTGCIARRAAPPGIANTEATLAGPEAYLGEGTAISRRLPGEQPAPQ